MLEHQVSGFCCSELLMQIANSSNRELHIVKQLASALREMRRLSYAKSS